MAESVVVELYEHEVMQGKIWLSYEKKPWVNKASLEPSQPPDEIDTPSPEWNWESNWKIEKMAGFTDGDGWEYASKSKKFYGYKRQPKAEGKSSDKARRRVWCRVMRREVTNSKYVDIHKVIPRIQQGLTGIHSARMQIEDILRQQPEQAQTLQMQQLTHGIQRNIQELLGGLDTTEKQCKEEPGEQQYLAVLKKLRNDCLREQVSLASAMGSTVPGDSAATEGRSGGSRRGSKRGTNISALSIANGTPGSVNSSGITGGSGKLSFGGSHQGGGMCGEVSSDSASSTPEPTRMSAGVLSSSKQGNIRGALSLTPVGGQQSTQLRTNAFGGSSTDGVSDDGVGDESNSGSLGDGFLGAEHDARRGGRVSQHDWDPGNNDGVFVDRHQHELMIEQKLKPVDEATIMQEIIEERAVEIEKMNKGIIEVNDMFVDLSRIVKEQQFEINSIFQNAEESAAKTQEAYQQVVQANAYHQNGNCIIS